MSDAGVLVAAKNIWKTYYTGEEPLHVLKGVDLDIRKGEAVCIMGSSGAGKSTLLHILGTLDRPSQGSVNYGNQETNTQTTSEEKLAAFRNRAMGFVFQFHHLLAEFNALENVMIPARIAKLSKREAKEKAEVLLEQLGLADRMTHFPTEMSGGEQQRVAIARALVLRPEILFADEPTGNLDTANSLKIQDLFFQLKETYGLTLIVVSHDQDFAGRFPRRMVLRDGLWQ
jgi:lipoprotein-releasing system ATP-binding protein